MFLSSLPLQDVMNNQQDQTLQTAFASMLRCQRTGDGPEPGEHEGRAGEACNPGLRVSVSVASCWVWGAALCAICRFLGGALKCCFILSLGHAFVHYWPIFRFLHSCWFPVSAVCA